MRTMLIRFVPGLLAACLGGAAGCLVCYWISKQGYYAPVIPGALAGLACGFSSIDTSGVRGGLCAVIALVAGIVSYWQLILPPFETDGGLVDVILHIHRLQLINQIMLAIGTFLGFWWGRESTSPWRHRFSGPPAGA